MEPLFDNLWARAIATGELIAQGRVLVAVVAFTVMIRQVVDEKEYGEEGFLGNTGLR